MKNLKTIGISTIAAFAVSATYNFFVPKERGSNSDIKSDIIYKEPNKSVDKKESDKMPQARDKSSYGYIIQEHCGNVAVFEDGKTIPFKVTDIQIKELPVDDQKMLKNGITATTKEELNALLEDYCS